MTFDTLGAGAGPSALGSPGGASLVRYPVEIYQSPLLDLSLIQTVELIPAKPGHIPACPVVQAFWIIEALNGTQILPPTWQVGSDPSHQNFIARQTTTTPFTGEGTNPPYYTQIFTSFITTAPSLPNLPTYLDILSAATGNPANGAAFQVIARLVVPVMWIAVAQ